MGAARDDVQPPAGDAQDESDVLRKRREIREHVYELVPSIGTRWRWYDIPYRFSRWCHSSKRQRFVPWPVRRYLERLVNFVIPFHEYARAKATPLDDPWDNLHVPGEEQIRQGGIWVAEFFPPSQYSALERALRANGWDRDRLFLRENLSNADHVSLARRRGQFSWIQLGSVVSPNSGLLVPDGWRESLPVEFSLVEITALQVGPSLTVVVAFFRLTDTGQNSLNSVWHAQHEPTFTWRGARRPSVENRSFAALRATQNERKRLHDLGRKWLSERCAGFFATTTDGQPVVDFTLFETFDPELQEAPHSLRAPLRALGMEGDPFRIFLSPAIPGCVFAPVQEIRDSEVLRNCWGVVGKYERVDQLNDQPGYGPRPRSASTFAAMFDDAIRSFILYTAGARYLRELRASYTNAQDSARELHASYRISSLKKLRRELLSPGLDLAPVARDLCAVWDKRWQQFIGIEVVGQAGPAYKGSAGIGKFSLIDNLGENVRSGFEELVADDAAYRDVLLTVATLGSSAESSRVGKIALWVALVSLAVAAITFLFADMGDNTIWTNFVKWIR
ncbi:hypothetical protein GCM10009681_56610 [Luedemannella helvata]|uniref:Uncharacterized protein n=2 Tax=Luedemannella helvata TaxID=349315 RepID=A0ABP4XFR6_9ACTN